MRSSNLLLTNFSYFCILFFILRNFRSVRNADCDAASMWIKFFEQFTSYLVIWNHFDCDSSIWALKPSIKDLLLSSKIWYFSVNYLTSSKSFLLIFSIYFILSVLSLFSYVTSAFENSLDASIFILFSSSLMKTTSFSFKCLTHSFLNKFLNASFSSGFLIKGRA